MTPLRRAAFGLTLSLPLLSAAQQPNAQAAKPAAAAAAKPAKAPYFLDPGTLDLTHAIPPPPAQDSAATRAELAEIHRIERTRTPELQAAAERDDQSEDVFLYAGVIGPGFSAEALPLTFALSRHIRNDVALINSPLKAFFHRPRPYNFDSTLHPICATNQEDSYPSGHSFNGYLYAFTLTQIFPDRSAAILARADEYAAHRVVCEAHYPSDIEASRRVAYIVFGALLENPRFLADLAAARKEIRQKIKPSE